MKADLLKVCFLYFFQLMGVSSDDQNTLEILTRFLLAKNSNVGKQKELTKAQISEVKIASDKLVFCSRGKTEQAHVRTFKRFCKVLTTNLIDMYPKNKTVLPALLKEILNLSKSKLRLFRYSFTYIGMQFFKPVLDQAHVLQQLKSQFQKVSNAADRVETIDKALDYVLEQNAGLLAKELVRERANDMQIFVRKCVFEQLQEFGANELKLAC